MMKTTLLDRNNVSEKALEILNKHPVYSLFYSSQEDSEFRKRLKTLLLNDLPLPTLLNAFTHRSFGNESEHWPLDNNERLEFVGDSVLDLIISEKLVEIFNELPEGLLSKLRSAVVNEDFLAKWANLLGLRPFVLLGKGELKNSDQIQDSIMADTFEAVLGAVYLNDGLLKSQEVLAKWIEIWEHQYGEAFFDLKRLEEFDPKSRLQEITLSLNGELPVYQSKTKADGNFEVSLFINGESLGSETSNSKRKAEKALAYRALKHKLIQNRERKEV